jgi:hypothetical protein
MKSRRLLPGFTPKASLRRASMSTDRVIPKPQSIVLDGAPPPELNRRPKTHRNPQTRKKKKIYTGRPQRPQRQTNQTESGRSNPLWPLWPSCVISVFSLSAASREPFASFRSYWFRFFAPPCPCVRFFFVRCPNSQDSFVTHWKPHLVLQPTTQYPKNKNDDES